MSILTDNLLISPSYLKENTILNLNIDENKLKSAIANAQNIDIHQILGTELLTKILTDLSNSNLTGNYQTLTETYVLPTIVQYGLWYATLDISFQAFNAGIVQRTSEVSNPSQLKEIQYLRNEIKNLAEFYSQRLKNYLCDNSNLFPEYFTDDDLHPQRGTSYTTGLVTSKHNKGNNIF